MANIALCVGDTGHASTSNAVSMLTAMGHSVVTYNESSVTLAQLNSADLICWLRSAANTVTSGLNNIKTAFDAGKPILFASKGGQTPNTIEPEIKQGLFLDFCSDQGTRDVSVSIIETGVGEYFLQTSTSFWYFIEQSKIVNSAAVLATYTDISGNIIRIASAFCYKGQLNRIGNPFPANIAFCGPLYSLNNTHTESTKNLLQRTINEVLSEVFNVSVSVSGLEPLPATILITNKENTFRQTFQTDNSGVYQDLILRSGSYTAVCFSNDVSKNSKAIDFTV